MHLQRAARCWRGLQDRRKRISAWAARHGGRVKDSTAEFTIEHATEIARLLDDAAQGRAGAGGCFAAAAESGDRFFCT